MKTPWATDQPEREWSLQQRAVFEWFKCAPGHLVIRARAGTGKTTTILEAISYIAIEPPGTKQSRILLAAFNKRIQVELGDKLTDERAEAKTLHALGFSFLRATWKNVKVDDQVEEDRIVDVAGAVPNDVMPLVKKLVSVLKGACPFAAVDDAERLAVDFGCEPENGGAWDTALVAKVARLAMLKAQEPDPQGRITFDDMLYIPLVCKMVRPTFDWVVVDEAQDMNVSQLLLAQRVCKPGGHIVVVGDDCQAIYGFRGADSGSIDRLKGELQANELGLTTTYRCPKGVVAVAQQLVGDYYAAPTAPEGYVASLPLAGLLDWAGPGDAILSRVNAPLVPLCLGFIRKGTPARIEGRDIGRTIAATVKKLHAHAIPDFLSRLRAYHDKWASRIRARGKGVEARLQELADRVETMAALAEGCRSVDELVRRCFSMFADSDGRQVAAVTLSSVHKAKGLEWTKVFLLERTLYCNGQRKGDLEERNIVYVAITRSKESLIMVQG